MKDIIWALGLALIFSCTHRNPEEIIKLVDEQIYYPQKQGLNSLICDVHSPYIDEMFSRLKESYKGSEKILNQLDVKIEFYWRKGYGSQYVIRGIPRQLSNLRTSIKEVFKGTDILIIPPTEQEQFRGYKSTLSKKRGKIEIIGEDPNPKSELRKYCIVVEPKSWLIVQRKFYTKKFISYSTPRFALWKGKRYTTRIDTIQHIEGSEDFRSWVKLEYQELGGFWLVSKITYKFELAPSGKRVAGPVEIDFTNCRINPPIPIDRFEKGKMVFVEPEKPITIPVPQEKEKPIPKEENRY